MKYNLKTKEFIMKWRHENLDAYREYQRIYANEHNDEAMREKKRLYYLANKGHKHDLYIIRKNKKIYEQASREYMNILLE